MEKMSELQKIQSEGGGQQDEVLVRHEVLLSLHG